MHVPVNSNRASLPHGVPQARNPENADLDCTAALFLLDAATARSMTELAAQ